MCVENDTEIAVPTSQLRQVAFRAAAVFPKPDFPGALNRRTSILPFAARMFDVADADKTGDWWRGIEQDSSLRHRIEILEQHFSYAIQADGKKWGMLVEIFKTKRIRLATTLILIAGGQLQAPIVHAFGTVNGLGQSAEHEKITRLALRGFGFEAKTLDEIAGKRGSFGAVGAPDRPDRGLSMNGSSFAHCDNGDFLPVAGYPNSQANAKAVLTSCRKWIFQNIDTAIANAGALLDGRGMIDVSQIPTIIPCVYNGKPGRAKCNVLANLGLALHASQDFYSHSNWSDENPNAPVSVKHPPGLGKSGPSPWINKRNASFPAKLITGCFEGVPESRHCDSQVRHEDLNKDKGSINVSRGSVGKGKTPRAAGNANFARAVTAAVQDSQAKWRAFEQGVLKRYGQTKGKRIICAMIKDDPTRTCP